ncbi:UNVERIFIED_CONTAM: hypothetical protein NCL1_34391 [Trichonephila clavipes]
MLVFYFLLSAGKISSFVFKNNDNTTFLSVVKRARDFVTRMILRVGGYFSHCSYKVKYLSCELSFLFQ